jgi:UDP-N-acetylglucosamine 1-carboxyvinyltransferase
MLPDMIEIVTVHRAGCHDQDLEINIKGCGLEHLGNILPVFQRLGIQMELKGDDIFIPAQERYEISKFIDGSYSPVADGPWPLFTPDLISIVLVVAGRRLRVLCWITRKCLNQDYSS